MTAIFLFIFSSGFAQGGHYRKRQQPGLGTTHGKVGFVGRDPSRKTGKVNYWKPKAPKRQRKVLYLPDSKIHKPKRRVKFMAAEKTSPNKNLRTPKRVNDKKMLLPEVRGNKKAKTPKYQYMGFDPTMGANNVKEKRNTDIQYKTAYKFGKKGGLDKTSTRKKKGAPE